MDFKTHAEVVAADLKRIIRQMERNLGEGEAICVSGMGPNCSEFFLQKFGREGNLIVLIGDADDSRFEQLIFSPDQISIRMFTAKRTGKRQPVGFTDG